MPRSSDTLCSTSVTLSNECQGGMDRNRESGNSDSAFSDSGEDVQGDQSTTSAIALAEAKLNGQSPQTASTGGDTAPSRLLARRASQQDAPLLALLDHNAPLLEVPARHEHYSRPNSMFGLFEHATARHPADTAASPLDTPREEEEPHVIPEETSLTAGDEDGWTGPHSPLPSFEQSQSAHGVHVPFSRSPGSSNLNAEARERPPFISVASGPLARLQEDLIEVPPVNNRRSFFSNFLPLRNRNASNSIPPATNSPSGRHSRNSSCPPSPSSPVYDGSPAFRPSDGMPASSSLSRSSSFASDLTRVRPSLGLGITNGMPRSVPSASGLEARPSTSSLRSSLTKAQSPKPEVSQTSSLAQMNVKLDMLIPSQPLSRFGLPLCGAVLDDQYLLIGTSVGMDFIPLFRPPGSSIKAGAPIVKRPLSLIKRTRFKQIVILKERSNILLAVAGRNDHVRVYALDGIRTMIEKKMKDHFSNFGTRAMAKANLGSSTNTSSDIKGKGRAPPPAALSLAASGSQSRSNIEVPTSQAGTSAGNDPPLSPPPGYASRRPSHASCTTPRPPNNRNRSHSIVSAVPTNPSLKTVRSRDTLRSARRASLATLHPTTPSRAHGRRASYAGYNSSHPADEEVSPLPDDTRPSEDSSWSVVERSSTESQESIPLQPSLSSAAGRMPRSARVLPEPESGSGVSLAQILQDEQPIAAQGLSDQATLGSGRTRSASQPSSPTMTRHRFSPRSASQMSREDSGSSFTAELTKFLSESAVVEEPLASQPAATLETVSENVTTMPNSNTNDSLNSQASADSALSNTSVTTMMRSASKQSIMSNSSSRTRLTPRSASIARMPEDVEGAQSLADFLRDGPPEPSTQSPQKTRVAAAMARTASTASNSSWRTEPTPSIPQSSSFTSEPQTIEENPETPNDPANTMQVTARQRKRWSLLRPASTAMPAQTTSEPDPIPEATRSRYSETAVMAVIDSGFGHRPSQEQQSEEEDVPSETGPNVDPEKERPVASSLPTLNETEAGMLDQQKPGAGNATASPAEIHPASATTPLDYVKLARTKGTRFIRASETSRRTYLAVLCGEAGERIELFTGSKNVSLSLNRTFVLPESPRSFEFQLQGDELVDIYLVYDESIFALEPSTVRVREVGVNRNERRAARRQRERERERQAESQQAASAIPSAGERSSDNPESGQASPLAEEPELPTTISIASARGSSANASKPKIAHPPFTTFQQLDYIPPVPPSVLAPAYVIPPTYDSVIASPQPGASATFSNPFHSTQATESSENLLSPISLLADHPARNAGKPGLFFVTRGRDNTNIVDGDGRSVIRQAITWQRSEPLTHNTPDHLRALHNFSRIEMMVVQGGRKTILVGVGATDLQALDIGGPSTQDQATPLTSVEVAPEAALRRKRLTPEGFSNLRDVVYLHNGLGGLYFCEKVGNAIFVCRFGEV